ncbi:MAG: hypothetical protein WCK11_05545 [Candidatus Falkowbacteria bacterium]
MASLISMSNAFKGDLIEEVLAIQTKDLRSPTKNMEITGEVLGKMNNFERQLITKVINLTDQANRLVEKINSDDTTQGEVKKLKRDRLTLKRKSEQLQEVFWFSVMDRLNLWEKSLTISEWSILDKGEDSSDVPAFIKDLLNL